ncbi:TMEM165/GDT1 family protein [Parahaliea mediterranea]|uniref:TMEM165/GDT1 family protein n=1 Tax=Parahaliea mediterranea TaxID=651086 RepID=UPI0019D47768|nr:TMEM165/GDT1 family protein [Parahaliea mediterranea]
MDAFLTPTLTVALAEIGDKTQLLSLVLATRFRNKWGIVLGILVATLVNHGVSAWLGGWIGQFLQGPKGRWLIGASFIALGLWLLIPDKDDSGEGKFQHLGVLGILPPNIAKTARGRASRDFWRPITYRLSAGSLQSMPLNPQVLADRLSVRTCIYPGG